MIKNIIFDMGNVLCGHDAAAYCRSAVQNSSDFDLLYAEVFCSVEWLRMDRGVLNEQEAIQSICARLPGNLHERVAYLITHWYDHFIIFEQAEILARDLKQKGYKLYLLSNAGYNIAAFKPRIKALQYFDGLVVSCEIGLLKPDHKIFDHLLHTYGLKAGECFFVDDMNINVEAALTLGFSGHLFRGDFGALRQALLESGVAL